MRKGWEYKKLGEVASYINGYAFKPEQWKEHGTPIIRIQNLNNPEAPFNYFDGEVPEKVKVQEGDLLISWSASLGAYIWHGDNAFLNQHIFKVVFDKTDIDKMFLKYAVTSKLEEMVGQVHGATMKHIVKKDFDNTRIPFPPKSTQLAIVSELDKINELIRLKKEQLVEYGNLAQTIFYEMFGDPVENEKGWEVKKLGDIGRVITGNTPSRSNEIYYNNPYIEWIKTDNILDNQIFPSKAAEYLSENGSEVGRTIENNSLLVACIAGSLSSIGKCCITNRKVAFNQQINGITPYKDKINVTFLYCMISFSKKYIQEFASNGMKHILSKSNFEKIPFAIPPLPLQQSFASHIEQIEKLKSEVQNAITDLETLLASRMQYWFE